MKLDQNKLMSRALKRNVKPKPHKKTALRKYRALVAKETPKHIKKSCGRCGGPDGVEILRDDMLKAGF